MQAGFSKQSLTDGEIGLLNGVVGDWSSYCELGNWKPNNPDAYQDNLRIRADIISWLCMEEDAKKLINPKGIKVCNALITDRIELLFVNLPFPLAFRYCWLDGGINLTDAQIPGLVLSDSYAADNVAAEGTTVRRDILLRNFVTESEMALSGAQLGGLLDCRGATFKKGSKLYAKDIRVEGSVLFTDGFKAEGEVQLPGARVGGDIDCSGAVFVNPGRVALNISNIDVEGSVLLESSFRAEGQVNLDAAQISGRLSCIGGIFANPGGNALTANRAIVKSAILLQDGFTANGRVNLDGVQVGGDLVCSGGNFQNSILSLTDASSTTLVDSGLNDVQNQAPTNSPTTVWPQYGRLYLDGFIYGRISSEGRIDVDKRLSWLGLQSPFYPRPYIQLAKVLRESGDEPGARRVLVRMEDLARKDNSWGPVVRPLLRLTIGYGYEPLRAFWWAAGLSALGWIIYRRSYLAGSIVPTDKDAYVEFKKPGGEIPAQYPSFSPLIYSVENSLPLVKLGQGDKWQPAPPRQSSAVRMRSATEFAYRIPREWLPDKSRSAWRVPIDKLAVLWVRAPRWLQSCWAWISATTTSPRFVMWFLWIQILLGWLLATLVIAGVSGIVHKE